MSEPSARKRTTAEPAPVSTDPIDTSGALTALPARDFSELQDRYARLRHKKPIRLDEALLALGLVDIEQLERAHTLKTEDPSELFGAILRRIGAASEDAIHAGLAYQLGIPAVDLRSWPIDADVLSRLPSSLARYHRAVPIHHEGNVLYVATSDVLDRTLLDATRLATQFRIQPVYASPSDIQWLLDKYEPEAFTQPVSDEDLQRNIGQYTTASDEDPAAWIAPSDNVIVRLADQIITEAHRERASDIHIEPMPKRGKTIVRVRIDGQMFARRTIPWAYRDALVSRYKVMANMDVAEHRVPQDGKIFFRRAGAAAIELRVAILPTAGGVEDVVLRILDTSKAMPLTALGLGERDHHRFADLVEKPYGILLVCGPTGSGKTTTLHAALHELNDGARKIWTVENPVEITQPGLRQVEVNPRAGLTFATALRAFLRADPDVIMVGEIRDAETAKTALEASLTGHLVLSTLHTNNAPESVVRLLEMGMNPFNFSDSLLGILAQRLVRCLCKQCREPVEADDTMLAQLAREYLSSASADESGADALIADWRREHGRDGAVTLYHARGCAECAGLGYKGRAGLFELMSATPEVKRLIIGEAAGADLFELAVRQGMSTLKQDGIHKVLDGTTDLAQVLAVSQR